MTTTPQAAREQNLELAERITAYMFNGGLFNPEMANHEAVRDLLIECRAALSAIAAEEAQGWIPVTERLPEKFVEVLVTFAGHDLASTGQYTDSKHDHNGWCYPAENNGIDDDESDPTVTHWQPLPAAPGAAAPSRSAGEPAGDRAQEQWRHPHYAACNYWMRQIGYPGCICKVVCNVEARQATEARDEIMRLAEDFADWQRLHGLDFGEDLDVDGDPIFLGTPEVASTREKLRSAVSRALGLDG